MTNFALLDTPEYNKIIDGMMGVSTCFTKSKGVYAFDIKTKLVFEFGCVAHAIECDNDNFIIFVTNDCNNEVSIHASYENYELLYNYVLEYCKMDPYRSDKNFVIITKLMDDNKNIINYFLKLIDSDNKYIGPVVVNTEILKAIENFNEIM